MRKPIWVRAISMVLVLVLAGCSTQTMAPTASHLQTGPNTSATSGTQNDHTATEPTGDTVPPTTVAPTEPEDLLNNEQKNAIAMLNYLALATEAIHSSKNNRLMLEEIYTSLLNEINPGSIDDITQDHLNNVRNIIKEFLNIEAKREQMQFIYNQEKAATIRQAVPDPLAIISVTNSLDWKRLVAGVAFSVIDSYNNYKAANDSLEQEFLLSGWELDEEERNVILRNRDYTFNYMTDIVQDYGKENNKEALGKLTLNEKAIENFAEICAIDEVYRKIERLTHAEDTYKLFGNYWIELANCYYEIKEYQKCLDCITKYNDLEISIFRKDFNILPILPKAIVAAQAVYTGEEYIANVQFFADAIVINANADEWAVLYFAAQAYIDLFAKTNDREYLQKAYDIIKHNVAELIEEQLVLNATYLSNVEPVELDEKQAKRMSEEEKEAEQKRIDEYNKQIAEIRKTELPPICQPLMLNCELLFALAEELDVSQAEKDTIQSILQIKIGKVFLCAPINNQYSFSTVDADYSIELSKDGVAIPANLLTQGAAIIVKVTAGNETAIFNDFVIEEVERTGETPDSFVAKFTSKKMKDYKWSADAQISIEIFNSNYCDSVMLKYKVKEYKDNWIFPDTITFEKA